jgi:chromosome segregation ATPase
MLHLDDQTMPIYQQKVTREVNDLQSRIDAFRRELKDPELRSAQNPEDELAQMDASLREIEKKLDQMSGLPAEMRDRLREELDASLEELRTSVGNLKNKPDTAP